MKTVAVKIQFKNGNEAVVQVPVKQAALATFPSYRGNIVELTPAAVKEACKYVGERTGEKPNKSVMRIVDIVEKCETARALWTNGIQIVNKY